MERAFRYLLVVFSFSVASFSESGAVFSQAYDPDAASDGLQSFSLADDFVPYYTSHLSDVITWMTFNGIRPPSITLAILQDRGDMDPNNAILRYSDVLPAVYQSTGHYLFGSTVYEVTCTSTDWILLTGGQTYWIVLFVPVNGFVTCQNPLLFGSELHVDQGGVYQPISSLIGYELDSYFEIHGTVALERNSWGSIKASF